MGLGKGCKFLLKFKKNSLGEDLWSWCLIFEQKVMQTTPHSSCIMLPIISCTLHCLTSANTSRLTPELLWFANSQISSEGQTVKGVWEMKRNCHVLNCIYPCGYAGDAYSVNTRLSTRPTDFSIKKQSSAYSPTNSKKQARNLALHCTEYNQNSFGLGIYGVILCIPGAFPRLWLGKVRKEFV